jgi:hypothetical protein
MLPQLLLVEDDFLATIRKVSRDGYCRLHVDPSDAKSLLERNTNNRKLRETVVDYYANEMINGNWIDNGDPIRIARSGRLLNGQHRLSAVVKAGVSLPFHFLSNLSEESFEQMDNGAKRTLNDNLDIVSDHVSILNGIYQLREGVLQRRRVGPSQIKSVVTDDILELIEEMPRTKRRYIRSQYVKAVTVACVLIGEPKERIFSRYHNIITLTPTNSLELNFNRWLTNNLTYKGARVSQYYAVSRLVPAFYKFFTSMESDKQFRLGEDESKEILKALSIHLKNYYSLLSHP